MNPKVCVFLVWWMCLGFAGAVGSPGDIPLSAGAEVLPAGQKEATFSETALRGYGRVAATGRQTSDGSLLEVTCESPVRAQLLQAKYLSDLELTPEVGSSELKLNGLSLNVKEIKDQGAVAAVQIDRKVFLAASPSMEGLSRLLGPVVSGRKMAVASSPQCEVPMFLNRWDKYGFRFYYSYPWSTPANYPGAKGQKKEGVGKPYDQMQDFDFAAAHDRAGLVFWLNPLTNLDAAEGLMNQINLDYAIQASALRRLPVGVNLGVLTAPLWLFNRWPDQVAHKMPQVLGDGIGNRQPFHRWTGKLSAASTSLLDTDLGMCQDIVRRFAAMPNVVSFLEPHCELRNFAGNIFMEYGPLADAKYQDYLRLKYPSLTALNAAWGASYRNWMEIRVPEMAAFAHGNSDAFDLAGLWRVAYEVPADGAKYKFIDPKLARQLKGKAMATEGAPPEWFAEKFDDSSWPAILAPGDDIASILPSVPAVYRRTFEVPAEWLRRHPRTWLYLWDLSEASGDAVKTVLNGQTVGEDRVEGFGHGHWAGYEVSGVLRSGTNQLSIRLPKGAMGYRIYLAGEPPRQYPDCEKSVNARWVDFSDWSRWIVADAVQRGIEMIRQIDPDRPIDVMSPDYYVDGIVKLAKAYGANFKNTGHMAGFWGDALPAIMRGAGLPFSVEPGHPARDLAEFKKQIGLWSTEGIQGIDYFQHIGFVMWNPELRDYYEQKCRLLSLVGKYHAPRAEVAALYSNRARALCEFPWNNDPNRNLDSGYYAWNVRANLRGLYESDALTECAFADGDAARYRVIIDTNTSVMDEELLAGIETFVRNGGVFVTFVQSGRHTPTEPDRWPIQRLTGYAVTGIDPLGPDGEVARSRTLQPATGQTVFSGNWNRAQANGLSLRKISGDTQDLMLWQDGSVAVGMRSLGKGAIIQVGCKFSGTKIPDRLNGSMQRNLADPLTRLLSQILASQGVAPAAVEFRPLNVLTILRHYVTNNGLYDVWALYNQSDKDGAVGNIVLKEDKEVPWAIKVSTEEMMAVQEGNLAVSLGPMETEIFLTPRHRIAQAAAEWFALQRDWWQGTVRPSDRPLPATPHRFSLNLEDGWAFRPLAAEEDGASFAATDVPDSNWERMPLGVWNLRPGKKDVHDAIFRKSFTVPSPWNNGDVVLSILSGQKASFADEARLWVDGKLVRDWSAEGVAQINPEGIFRAGTTHSLALEIRGKGPLNGSRSSAWLWYWPQPQESLDLAGKWDMSDDLLHYDRQIPLPGPYQAFSLRRVTTIPEAQRPRNVILNIVADGALIGVNFNGRYLSRSALDPRFQFNVTPWVKFGEENRIELINDNGPGSGTIKSISLDFYDKDKYP